MGYSTKREVYSHSACMKKKAVRQPNKATYGTKMQEQTKPQISRKKIIKIRAEINKTEAKNVQRINETLGFFFSFFE
jgi:hypothetical protein